MKIQAIKLIPISILSSKNNEIIINRVLRHMEILNKFITINEGSHTKLISYLNKNEVHIKILEHNEIKTKNSNRKIRYVWLETSAYTKMTFARSLWILKREEINLNKIKRDAPIGKSFIKKKLILVKK